MDPFTAPTPDTSGLTLAAFLGRLDGVDAEDDGYLSLCPAHEDTDPSLRVAFNPERKTIMIHCRAGCETPQVLTAMGLRMPDLFNVEPGDVDDLRLTGAVEAPVSIGHRAALAQYIRATAEALTDEAATYASDRFGITRERATGLRLGFDGGTGRLPITIQGKRANGLSGALYRDAPRLTVPFYDFQGHTHYLQARAIVKPYTGAAKWSGPANPDGEVWGRYGWFPGDTGWLEVIVTEGPGDGLTAVGLGYDTLLIRGAGLGDSAELANALAALRPDARVILAGDNDKAGGKFNARVGQRMTDAGLPVFVLQLPDTAEDITHWRESDPDAFPHAFSRAVRSANPWVPLTPETTVNPNTAPRPNPAEDRLPHTELANAQRLVQRMEGLLRHTPALGFLVWNGSAWEVDNRSRVRQAAQQSAIALMEEALAMPIGEPGSPEDKRRKSALHWAHDSQRSRGIEAVMKEVQALPGVAVAASDLDAKPDRLACRNGTVNLKTGTLTPADPDDLLTMALDVDYDPAAEAPRWEQFLEECFPDEEEMPNYLRRLVGYGITGHATEQCYVMLHGRGGNGKSVFTSALYDVFGNITASVGIETFLAAGNQNDGSGASSDVASLRSARLVLTSEAETGARMAEAKLKRLTGGDPITARFLYREPFTFMPSFLLFMSTNAVPEVRDNSDGIWRRVKILEWQQQFTGARKDTRLSAKLRAEAPGILAWAVRGAVAWYQTGLGEPRSVTETVESHRAEADKLLEFYPGAVVNDADAWISRADLYAVYREWCDAEGHSRPWQNTTLYQELVNRGVDQSKRKGVRGFKGVRKARPTDSQEERAREAALTHLPDSTDLQAPSLEAFTV